MGMGGNKGTKVVLGQRGNTPPWSFSTKSPERRDTPSTLPLPPPMAGPPQCWSKGVACIGIAGPVGIGWMKHPLERVVMSR